jgi:hypothetical protein
MRVLPTAKNGIAAAGSARRAAGGSGFNVEGAGASKSASAAGAALGIHSVDALLALQGVEDVTERRRRFAEVTLQGLAERSGEKGLDDVLAAIGVRVAVEIAKRTPRPVPA